jgi:hypothetical protein
MCLILGLRNCSSRFLGAAYFRRRDCFDFEPATHEAKLYQCRYAVRFDQVKLPAFSSDTITKNRS